MEAQNLKSPAQRDVGLYTPYFNPLEDGYDVKGRNPMTMVTELGSTSGGGGSILLIFLFHVQLMLLIFSAEKCLVWVAY
jgi:hypothetical protein